MNGIFSLSILAAALVLYFSLGILRWVLGLRREALQEFEKGLHVLIYLLVVALILRIVDELAAEIGLKVKLSDPISVETALQYAASVFWNASRVAVDAVLFVGMERAILASAPLTTPLSSVLGAATGWSLAELSIVAIFFMHLSFASQVISQIATPILSIGASLTPVPATRKAGAALLAAYLSATISLSYAASMTADVLQHSRVPSIGSVEDWFKVAEIVGNLAVSLGSAATRASIALVLGSIAGIGLTNLFGAIYVSLTRP